MAKIYLVTSAKTATSHSLKLATWQKRIMMSSFLAMMPSTIFYHVTQIALMIKQCDKNLLTVASYWWVCFWNLWNLSSEAREKLILSFTQTKHFDFWLIPPQNPWTRIGRLEFINYTYNSLNNNNRINSICK